MTQKTLALKQNNFKRSRWQAPVITGILTIIFIGFGILLFLFLQNARKAGTLNSIASFYMIRLLYVNLVSPIITGILCMISTIKAVKKKGGSFL